MFNDHLYFYLSKHPSLRNLRERERDRDRQAERDRERRKEGETDLCFYVLNKHNRLRNLT